MSEYFTTIAVKAEKISTIDKLKLFFDQQNISYQKKSVSDLENDEISCCVNSFEGWTVLYFPNVLLIPKLAGYLSIQLITKVVSVSYESVSGFSHFSVLENGNVDQIFTLGDELYEKVNVDSKMLFEQAQQTGKLRFPPGRQYTEYDYDYEALNCFKANFEPNLDKASEDIWNRLDTECYSFKIGSLKEIANSGIYIWSELV